jgi:hypothetical protein
VLELDAQGAEVAGAENRLGGLPEKAAMTGLDGGAAEVAVFADGSADFAGGGGRPFVLTRKCGSQVHDQMGLG